MVRKKPLWLHICDGSNRLRNTKDYRIEVISALKKSNDSDDNQDTSRSSILDILSGQFQGLQKIS